MESKYLHRFKKLKNSRLKGNLMLIEKLTPPEVVTKSGLIVMENNSDIAVIHPKPSWYLVLEVGEGYVDDNGDPIGGMDVEIGDVVLMGDMQVKIFGRFPGLSGYTPDTIGIAKESDVQMVFGGIEDVQGYLKELNDEK